MSNRKPEQFRDFPDALMTSYGPYLAVVQNVVDGDTLDVLMDLGFNEYRYHRVRVLDVNAPETNRSESHEAGLAAKAFVKEVLPIGTKVLLYTKPDPDAFGRYLAEVRYITPDNQFTSLASELLMSGHAVPFRK